MNLKAVLVGMMLGAGFATWQVVDENRRVDDVVGRSEGSSTGRDLFADRVEAAPETRLAVYQMPYLNQAVQEQIRGGEGAYRYCGDDMMDTLTPANRNRIQAKCWDVSGYDKTASTIVLHILNACNGRVGQGDERVLLTTDESHFARDAVEELIRVAERSGECPDTWTTSVPPEVPRLPGTPR